MLRITEVSERCGQVGRADEDTVYPLDAADRLQLLERGAGLDLYQQTSTKFPDSYAAPMAMVGRAKLLNSLGKPDEAKRAYESVISQYPESILAREAMRDMQLMRKK